MVSLHELLAKRARLASAVIDLATHMAQDTFLMLQAGQQQTRLCNANAAAIQKTAQQIAKLQTQLSRLDTEIQQWLSMYELWSRTA